MEVGSVTAGGDVGLEEVGRDKITLQITFELDDELFRQIAAEEGLDSKVLSECEKYLANIKAGKSSKDKGMVLEALDFLVNVAQGVTIRWLSTMVVGR